MIKKVSIIGAGGVGSTLAFHLISRKDLKELVLLDTAGTLAHGVALDLEDTRRILSFSTKITGTKNFSHIKDSDIVVITAGVARKEGMSRLDLLSINAKITAEVSHKIKKHAPLSLVIVVTNPLDMITKVVTRETGFDRKRVIGMGSSLDSNRLFNLLHKRTGIAVSSFDGYVYGPHSNAMIVSPHRIRVGGQPLSQFLTPEITDKLIESVRTRGAQIVAALKTKSAVFAPSLACCELIEAIDADRNECIPASVLLKGEYGLHDVCAGVPCIINRKGIGRIIEIELTPEERAELLKIQALFKESGV